MLTALGAHSPQLVRVRALQTKAGRREQGRFAVDGATMLGEALAAGRVPDEVYGTAAALATIDTNDPRLSGRIFVVPDKAFGRLSDLETPPGLLAVHATRFERLADVLAEGLAAVVLAGVADPGNAGTLLRSAEIFGIGTAIFTQDAVDAYNPKTVRATMGAIFRMRVATSAGAELLAVASGLGYRLVAAARDGDPLPAFHFPERALLAIGSERHGVSRSLPHVDAAVSIPHAGAGESLNASVAGGIIFYAFSQQRAGHNGASLKA
ncbi:MAG: RNA methyltransferase [Vulcanimicrobiaceae bacterium]